MKVRVWTELEGVEEDEVVFTKMYPPDANDISASRVALQKASNDFTVRTIRMTIDGIEREISW